jgi:hypothetical protein
LGWVVSVFCCCYGYVHCRAVELSEFG